MQIVVLLWCVLALLATAITAVWLVPHRAATPLIYAAAAGISALMGATAFAGLAAGTSAVLRLPLGLPWVGANFHIDTLSSLFLLIVNIGALGASLYAIGYGRHEPAPQRVLPLFPAFLAGLNLVVLADDAFTFLLSWEFMSLTSWALVMAHHRSEDNARAGYVYILMASFGTFALLLAFGLLAGPDGHYGFEAMRASHLSASNAALVLLLVLVGAGSKAGLVPLHVWLPLAHPAAPSHVSALMSGVMTKVAIYAFIRIVFDLLGPPAWWWGIVVLALGSASALMGVVRPSSPVSPVTRRSESGPTSLTSTLCSPRKSSGNTLLLRNTASDSETFASELTFQWGHSPRPVMLKPVFYDFEASGFNGFPIEVGWAFVDDSKRIVSDSSLILPDPKWNLAAKWDVSAEQIHGISLKHLMEKGTPTRQVTQQLNQALAGLDLYSDSLFDQKWMGQLFEAASIQPTFKLQDKPAPLLIEELRADLGFTEDDVAGLYRVLDHKAPHLDRAKPDARHWAARWQALLKVPRN